MNTNTTFIQRVRPWSMRHISKRSMDLAVTAVIGAGLIVAVGGHCGAGPARSKALTAEAVIQLWSPQLKNSSDYGQMGGSPEQAPNVAAYSFRVVGPTFEELWSHYARLCGVKERHAGEKDFLITSGTSSNGSYVLSERASGDGKGGRGPTVFLLQTDTYTVTATFQSDSDGKSISGSLTAVVR